MISEAEANEKVREGWIKSWMAFEVLAINEKTARESLEGLIDKLDKSENIELFKKEFGSVKRVDRPLRNVETGFSVTCDVEIVSKKLEYLVQTVIEFGPSAVEVLEPLSLNLKVGEAQNILNTISEMMHRFAAAGAGGILVLKEKV
jgi:hypothetical protein